jgi:acetyltransferase-like isoleucine patch superfamily enzyme
MVVHFAPTDSSEDWVEEIMEHGLIHESAIVETAAIGRGTRVWAFAHVMHGATVGQKCNIGEGVFIESGVRIGDNVTVKNGVAIYAGVEVRNDAFLGPHCVFTNDRRPRSGRYKRTAATFESTVIDQGATVGANATIVCGIRVGRYAMVGAGSVVTRGVDDFMLVRGVPARLVGPVCACGERLGEELICACGLRYAFQYGVVKPLQAI